MLRFTRTHVLILCPLGHTVYGVSYRDWAGSYMEAEIAAYQAGKSPHLDRLIAQCDGTGHALKED